ncbi:unnamed protein product [Calypogeia fissa]
MEKSSYDELRHPIHVIAAELGDASPCTRRSALGKLQCALTSGILATCDPEKDTKALFRSLLEWFNLPSPSHEILVLSMLSRLAQDDVHRKILVDLGAVEFMEQFQFDCCQTIVPYIAGLRHNLLKSISKTVEETVRPIYLRDTEVGYAVPATQLPSPSGRCQDGEPVRENVPERIRCREQERSISDACQVKGRMGPLTIEIPERNEPLKEDREPGLHRDGHCERFPRGEMGRCAPTSRSRADSPASATRTEPVASQPFQPRPSSREGQEKEITPTPISFLLKQPPESQLFTNVSHTDHIGPTLPCVDLEEGDEKYLLNLNVSLQNLDNREALRSALKELREAAVFDFHPEAFFQKHSIVQNAFVLFQKIMDNKLERILFDILAELVRKIKAALKLSREAGLQVHLDNESPSQGLQDNGGSSLVKSGLDLKCSYPVYLKQSTHDALDDEKVLHLLDKVKLDNKGSIQPVISLGRTLHLVALQLISLLVNERHRDMTFAILYDLLPLLKPPDENSLDEKVQARFSEYFHALSEVLQTVDENSQDLETICMDVTTKQDFYEKAHRCSPVLRVLSFSAELLCLLQPSHVAGLLPHQLLKALITLSGDLILAECTFGLHKMIFPYLKYLSPEFFESYSRATEASFTLHVLVKELASSEEAVANWKAKRLNASLEINTETLFKCMIQAAPNYSYFNHKYLIPRILHIIPDVLRIELLKICRANMRHQMDSEKHDGSSQPFRSVALEGVIGLARSSIWLLLSHATAPVRQVAYDSLLEVSSKERWHAQQHSNSKPQLASGWEEACAVGGVKICIGSDESDCIFHCRNGALQPLNVLHRLLIFGTSIMGEIIATGLHDTATCKQSAVLLEHLAGELSETEREYLIPGYPWIACSAYLSPDILQIVEKLNSILFAAKPSLQKERSFQIGNRLRLEWAQLSCTLRSLFSSCTAERYRASTELFMILRQFCTLEESCWWLRKLKSSDPHSIGFSQGTVEIPPDDPFQCLKDPFQKCLKFKEATLFSMAFGSSTTGKRTGKCGIPAGGQKKAEELLGIFKSHSVGEPLRKTAVEHLTWLIQDQSLRALLDNDEELFKALIVEIFDWMRKGSKPSDSSVDASSDMRRHWSPEKMGSLGASPTDLGIACLSLLARLAPASATYGEPNLRDMLIGDSCKVLWLLIPLVFHPFECVRKDMALLLAFTLFSSDLLLRDLQEVVFDHDPSQYPFSTTKDIVGANLNSGDHDIWIAVPFPFIGRHLFPCQVVCVAVRAPAKSSADSLVDEKLIHRIIAQSVLLKGGHENLLISLESRVASAGDPLRTVELQAMACLSVLHADIIVKKLLKLLADPQLCWGSETQFLEELEGQCFRHPQAAKMLARSSWVVTFQRFLTRIPSTPEESAQLLKVLRLVQIIISSKSSGYSGLLFMTMVSKQILLPILAKSPTPRVGANLHHSIVLIEGYPACDIDFTILRLFVDILVCSKEHGDASLFGQTAAALAKGTSLLPVLLSKFIKGPSAPYLCCVLAVQCVSLVAKGIAAALSSDGYTPGYSQQKDKESSSEGSSEQGDAGLRNFHDDQEATIRGMGYGILAVLASPVTVKTRALLEQNWPELGDVAVHTILNTKECYAVRQEALRFLISTTIWSSGRRLASTVERDSMPAGFERIDSLGVNAALQRYRFWLVFTRMLEESNGTPGFHRVLLELILKLTVSDLGFIKSKLYLNPCIFDLMIEYLEFGTENAGENVGKCVHAPDICSVKSYIGEIICILSQQEDAQIQSLVLNEYVVRKLLCALSYCLSCPTSGSEYGNTNYAKKEGQDTVECSRQENLHSETEYERLEAIFHVSEALNLVVSQLLQAAAPPNRTINHVRVSDIMSLNLTEGKSQGRPIRGGLPFQSGFHTSLGAILGKSGVCRRISHILSRAPLIKNLQSAGQNDTGRILSVLLRRVQLAVCALLATFLSEESLAKAVLENDGVDSWETTSGVGRQKPQHLAPILYNAFLLILKEIHELGRKHKVSHNGDILVFLYTMLFTVGVALQNLSSFSSQAREFAVDSDLPSKLVGHAYEAYALLGSCGLAPMRTVLTTTLAGSNNHRSKPCNKVPKLVNQPVRPSVWSRKAKQGKLSEHHRSLLLGELIIYFRLLKNLVFENPRAAEACGGEGIFDFIRLIWGFALSEEDLLNEILGLLCNLAAQSDAAKEAMACQTQICQGGKGGSLLDYATVIVLRRPSEQQSYTLAVGLLQILVTMAKARAIFLRKQYLAEFLQHYRQSVHNNDALRQHLLLQLLINVSVYPNGQKMLSKGLSDGSMLDLVLDTVEQTHYVPASSSALLLLRNLAFCRETRFFFLCNERTLPLLVKSLESSSLEARANAASALWILTSTEKRISSVLKKIDACPSLLAAHEASKLHLKIFSTHVRNGAHELDGAGSNGAPVSKMAKLVSHIEQSLFAVNQLIGAQQEYD